MTDSFRVIGDVIEYGPWIVGQLRTDIPATVRDRVEMDIDRDPEAIYTQAEYDDEYERGFREGRAEGEDEETALRLECDKLRAEIQQLRHKRY